MLFGLVFLLALGPAFFALIQTSIQQGFRKAIFFALGISLADSAYVMITLFGLSGFMETDSFRFWMAIFGSIMLSAYAIYSWVKQPIMTELELANDVNYGKYIVRGFFLNGLNPFILISWATWISAVTVNFNYQFTEQVQFFIAMLVTILSMDIGKAFIADKLKHLITVRFVRIMNRTVAVILLLFTARIFYFLYENYYL